jgi:hypothetical protein
MASLAVEWDDYLAELREDAHQLLAWSYADKRPNLTEAKDEYEMTGLLAEGMDARINSPRTPWRFTLYGIHNEKPTSPTGELGKKRPRLDIQIERNGMRPKPHFTFEAKRLRDDTSSSVSDTMREYLGAGGIGRFVTGRYAPESIEAAMLGCVQARSAEFWFDQVGIALDFDATNGGTRFATVGHLAYAKIIEDFPDERISVHTKQSGVLLRIFHLFIDCR